jgi:hypothetical protein
VFHPSLIQQLLEHDLLEQAEGGVHRAKFSLGGKKIQTAIVRALENFSFAYDWESLKNSAKELLA